MHWVTLCFSAMECLVCKPSPIRQCLDSPCRHPPGTHRRKRGLQLISHRWAQKRRASSSLHSSVPCSRHERHRQVCVVVRCGRSDRIGHSRTLRCALAMDTESIRYVRRCSVTCADQRAADSFAITDSLSSRIVPTVRIRYHTFEKE